MRRPALLQDPAFPSVALFAAMVVGGFVAIGLGWRVAARTRDVAFQTPALISGGLGGLALVLLGIVLLSVQSGRRVSAIERAETELLLDEVAAVVEAMKKRRR